MDNFEHLGVLFLALTILSYYFAYLWGKKTKDFRWLEYLSLLAVPLIYVTVLAYYIGWQIVHFFFASMLAGLTLEYLLGLAYHKVLNKRLWTYSRFDVGGYTSWLTLPMWGIAGVIFWSISNSIGL